MQVFSSLDFDYERTFLKARNLSDKFWSHLIRKKNPTGWEDAWQKFKSTAVFVRHWKRHFLCVDFKAHIDSITSVTTDEYTTNANISTDLPGLVSRTPWPFAKIASSYLDIVEKALLPESRWTSVDFGNLITAVYSHTIFWLNILNFGIIDTCKMLPATAEKRLSVLSK